MFGIGKLEKKKIEIQRNRQVREQDIVFNLSTALISGLGKGLFGLFKGNKSKKRKKQKQINKKQEIKTASISQRPSNKKRIKQMSPIALGVGLLGSFLFVQYRKKKSNNS